VKDPDAYTVLAADGISETRVQGSRFLGFVFPARSAEEAEGVLDSLRRKHRDATHVCFAWRIGPPEESGSRASDAGEPSGTAGAPILAALERAGVSDALAVVVRWFGGTKLGTGGLARAYGECARLALDTAPRGERVLRVPLAVAFAYAHAGRVLRLAEKHRTLIETSDYGEEVRLRLAVPRSRAETLRGEIVEATAGAARFEG
jgi:uncharacterized YigZ family protein